jgi:hypothetical protein
VKPSYFTPRGTGPTIAAVERREASIPAGMQGARYGACGPTLLVRPKGAVAQACRCTRAPVGAPLPSHVATGKQQTSGEPMPRENDGACAPSGGMMVAVTAEQPLNPPRWKDRT